MANWYDQIEEPIRPLVRLLRDNGFNTTCSCGHTPEPYIEMEWYFDDDIKRLRSLLLENSYKNFELCARWLCGSVQRRILEVRFELSKPLVQLRDIKA